MKNHLTNMRDYSRPRTYMYVRSHLVPKLRFMSFYDENNTSLNINERREKRPLEHFLNPLL